MTIINVRWWLYNLNRRLWFSPIRWWLWSISSRVRYRLTGDCGNACGVAVFRGAQPPHNPVLLFVPEAECPIHDRYSAETEAYL